MSNADYTRNHLTRGRSVNQLPEEQARAHEYLSGSDLTDLPIKTSRRFVRALKMLTLFSCPADWTSLKNSGFLAGLTIGD